MTTNNAQTPIDDTCASASDGLDPAAFGSPDKVDPEVPSLDEPSPSAPGAASETPTSAAASEGLKASHADKVRFIGLVAFLVVLTAAVFLAWPYISMIFEPDGLERLMDCARDAGWAGVLLLEAFQFLQVVVAFIPGEITQIAAGLLYGPWAGAAIILVGCIVSSAFIFILVHKLGAPFVHDMVPAKYMDKFREFEHSGKFETVVFILFLIPGMPKDVFTYLTPLSDMKLVPFLTITNLARIPGIVISTYAADGLMEGRVVESVLIFLGLAVVAGIGLVIYNKVSLKRKSSDSDK